MSRHILNVQCGGLPRSDQGTKNLACLPISLASISMLACSRKIVGLTNCAPFLQKIPTSAIICYLWYVIP